MAESALVGSQACFETFDSFEKQCIDVSLSFPRRIVCWEESAVFFFPLGLRERCVVLLKQSIAVYYRLVLYMASILIHFLEFFRLCRSLHSWQWIFWSLVFLMSCWEMHTMLSTSKVSHPLHKYLLTGNKT